MTAKFAYGLCNSFYDLRQGSWATVNLFLIGLNYAAISYCC